MRNAIIKNYVSDIDQFIHNFDALHPEASKSQQKEIKKHDRIFSLRDHQDQSGETDPFSDLFS